MPIIRAVVYQLQYGQNGSHIYSGLLSFARSEKNGCHGAILTQLRLGRGFEGWERGSLPNQMS